MKVAIVHDDLVQWGGAERVLEGLCEIYPDAPIFTSVFNYSNQELAKRFGKKDIRTSFLQKIPFWKQLYKVLLPLYPIAFEQFDFTKYDLVISHTTRFAKCIITKPETKHVSYVHTPPRFLWHFSGITHFGLGEILMNWLRIFDRVSSERVDFFLAGSKNAARRIKKIYRKDSKVVYPYINLERFKNIKTSDGDYFVIIGRPNKYKRHDLAINACYDLGINLKIVAGGFSDTEVIQILANCKALIIPGIEDFGLTSLEAQALGKPVIAFKEGGTIETVIEGKTGVFFTNNLTAILKEFDNMKWDSDAIKNNAQKFSKENFTASFQQTVASLW
jgi:glycosyltransferase involved in cell wall biosynthesis